MADETSGRGGPDDSGGGRSGGGNGVPHSEGWRRYGGPENPFPGGVYPPPNGPRGPRPGGSPHTDTRVFCILSYIGILWLAGLFAGRDDPKVRYHVNQGIILSIFEFAFSFLVFILKAFNSFVFIRLLSVTVILPQLGAVLNGILSFVLWSVTAVYIIIGIVHAAQDRQEPLPVIGTLFTVLP